MNDSVAAAVRSLESSRAALAQAFVSAPAPPGGRWGAVWDGAAAAAKKSWQHSALRPSIEYARPLVEDAVRRQPWSTVTFAALGGAVVVWIVSTRRQWLASVATAWWRTAGATMLASVALRGFEQFMAQSASANAAIDSAPTAASSADAPAAD